MDQFVMENKREEESLDSKYMKGVRHLCDSGVTRLPTKYILPVPDRPASTSPKGWANSPRDDQRKPSLHLPIIDLSELRQDSNRRSNNHVLRSLAEACEEHGFFQVVNHGVPAEVLRSMVDVSRRFFELPFEERARHMSSDIFAPVRCGTSLNQRTDRVFCWRDFLKLSCHPLPRTLPHWPSSPPDLRQVAVSYAQQTRSLFLVLMGAILETLGVEDCKPMMEEFQEGTQMVVMNFFPACPEPDLTLGMPPHSDYGFLTLVFQDGVRGLQIQHRGDWVTVEPATADSIVVNVGDHLEIFSNGKYKSALHRVVVNSAKPRISLASFHSLPAATVVSPAPHLVDAHNPRRYLDTDFAAFLAHLSSNETKGKSFLDSRKLHACPS
ncbi:hypothetical protein Taro_004471 [Colocasia esculenta]|uniref:Fe2OG dioxygenase domain-containing protein n=1 Tax=Colocasia esculenta TaxID=4460 RepID=A0A843TM17_COLES|nr:hypothetical protein [Colocasia esculenta]